MINPIIIPKKINECSICNALSPLQYYGMIAKKVSNLKDLFSFLSRIISLIYS